MSFLLTGRRLLSLSTPLIVTVLFVNGCQDALGISNSDPISEEGSGEEVDLEPQSDWDHYEKHTKPEIERIREQFNQSWQDHFEPYVSDLSADKADVLMEELEEFEAEYGEVRLALGSLEFKGTIEEVQTLNAYRGSMLDAVNNRLRAADEVQYGAAHKVEDGDISWDLARAEVEASHASVVEADEFLSIFESGVLLFE
ncbi:hypothetical protein [Planococcus wigleyi]|uniref:Uncharacterized protein n=1 Tax=Planococcus wigleyi TaxID=2762216 RepID=A0ABR8WGI9_9BACL|nr:hypothetical protein [Planococcus wigleyi]MBD8016115.1 hypothetical protein [Planococcus wigleyi]